MSAAESPKPRPRSGPSFDRIKPAPTVDNSEPSVTQAREDDHQGKRVLFSGADQPPSVGSVALDCSRCRRRSVVSFGRLAKLVLPPGVYLPVPGTSHRAWVRCPACDHRAWVTVTRKA